MGQITGPFLRSAVLSILKIFPNNAARAGLTLQIRALRCGDDLGLFWRLLRLMILHLRGGRIGHNIGSIEQCRAGGLTPILGVFQSGLRLAGVDVLWQIFAIGWLIIIAVAVDQWIRRVSA